MTLTINYYLASWEACLKSGATAMTQAPWLERPGMAVFGRWSAYHETPGAIPETRDDRLDGCDRIHYGVLALYNVIKLKPGIGRATVPGHVSQTSPLLHVDQTGERRCNVPMRMCFGHQIMQTSKMVSSSRSWRFPRM